MRHFFQAMSYLLLVAAPLACVAPIKLAKPPAQEVKIEPGKLTVDGVERSVPFDVYYSFSNGNLVPHPSGFKFEPIIGASLVGLNASPWAAVRFVHFENIGSCMGFDKSDFTISIDWLYHSMVVGPGVAFPFDGSNQRFCFVAGFLF